jgi:hypothetical protein
MTVGEHPLVFPISELEFLLEAIGDSKAMPPRMPPRAGRAAYAGRRQGQIGGGECGQSRFSSAGKFG